MIEHSAADVLATYLIAQGLVTLPTQKKAWPLYVSAMPDKPDTAVVILDTVGTDDGREMRSGKRSEHPGVQVIIRHGDYREATKKMLAIMTKFDSLHAAAVVVESKTYIVQCVKRTTPCIPIGKEEGGERLLFSTNALVTYGENV